MLNKIRRATSCTGAVLVDWLDNNTARAFPPRHPYRVKLTDEELAFSREFFRMRGLDPARTVVMHCATIFGNRPGFETPRFWNRPGYAALMQHLFDAGWSVALIGWGNEFYDFVDDGKRLFLARRTDAGGNAPEYLTLFEAMALIALSGGFIGTDSWTWEVAYQMGKPTISFCFVRQHWASLHAPDDVRERAGHLYIENNPDATARQIFDRFMSLQGNHR